jgi:hypothetical protein
MALTAAAVAAYNQGRMELAEKYAQQACDCEAKRPMAEPHFQLARIRLNRRNFHGAWHAALQAMTLDHRYAARLPLDSEFKRNAAEIKPAWRQYATDLKGRLESAAHSAGAALHELAKLREEINRMKDSRAFEFFELAGKGLDEAKSRFQKMTELVNTLSPEAERSLKLLTDGLRGKSVFMLLEAEPHAQKANDFATRALAAAREAELTIQKVEELSHGLPPQPKVFFPKAVCNGLGFVGLFPIVMVVVGVVHIARWAAGYHIEEGIGASIVATLLYLALAIGIYSSFRWVQSKADYEELIARFDWQAANTPQTTAATDGTILGAN